MTVSILIADDQALVRAGFRSIVQTQPDFAVVGEAVDGRDAVDLVRRRAPDVVLMDVRMPGLDGIEATRRITAEHAGTAVLVLTTFDLDEYVYASLRAGASGFLLKDAPAADLINAVRVVAAGEALLAPSVTRRLIAEFAARTHGNRPRPAALNALTPRETDVLRLIARGLSNQEIAAELVVAEQTVKSHVGRILTKFDLRDRAQAVVFAYETGLVVPG